MVSKLYLHGFFPLNCGGCFQNSKFLSTFYLNSFIIAVNLFRFTIELQYLSGPSWKKRSVQMEFWREFPIGDRHKDVEALSNY